VEKKKGVKKNQDKLKKRLNCVRRCVVGHQMLRRLGVSVGGGGGGSVCSAVEEWLALYESTHAVHAMVLEEERRKEAEKELSQNESGSGSGGSGKLQREFHCGDDLILLAVHALLEFEDDADEAGGAGEFLNSCFCYHKIFILSILHILLFHGSFFSFLRTGGAGGGLFARLSWSYLNVGTCWSIYREKCLVSCCLLEYGLSKSPDNYHLKLLKLRLYGYLGGSRVALTMYEQLGPKHIQLETLVWWCVSDFGRLLLLSL
jgi:hypothetical protein